MPGTFALRTWFLNFYPEPDIFSDQGCSNLGFSPNLPVLSTDQGWGFNISHATPSKVLAQLPQTL
jgi:hypothetical protein